MHVTQLGTHLFHIELQHARADQEDKTYRTNAGKRHTRYGELLGAQKFSKKRAITGVDAPTKTKQKRKIAPGTW